MPYAGRVLDQRFLDNPLRHTDAPIRWHFRQAVFTKMKGAGEPSFEHDFQLGEDILERYPQRSKGGATDGV
jgi:ABC-type uncharacterized transport system YnjBCD ATPase subunit